MLRQGQRAAGVYSHPTHFLCRYPSLSETKQHSTIAAFIKRLQAPPTSSRAEWHWFGPIKASSHLQWITQLLSASVNNSPLSKPHEVAEVSSSSENRKKRVSNKSKYLERHGGGPSAWDMVFQWLSKGTVCSVRQKRKIDQEGKGGLKGKKGGAQLWTSASDALPPGNVSHTGCWHTGSCRPPLPSVGTAARLTLPHHPTRVQHR